MEEMINTYSISIGKPERGRDHSGDLGVDGISIYIYI
jgi:hypothetical protein